MKIIKNCGKKIFFNVSIIQDEILEKNYAYCGWNFQICVKNKFFIH